MKYMPGSLKNYVPEFNRLIAGETGQSIEKVAGDTDRDYWLNAEEALKYGLISRIISSRKDIEI